MNLTLSAFGTFRYASVQYFDKLLRKQNSEKSKPERTLHICIGKKKVQTHAQVLNVCGCFCVLVILANLGFYENHMYIESNGIETVAKYYVFVK